MKLKPSIFCLATLLLVHSARTASEVPPADVVPFSGLTAVEGCANVTLPPGFKMHPFAAEPDVQQPIAFCLDHRGRLWVAEGFTYPIRKGRPPQTASSSVNPTPDQLKDIFGGKDRILVLEDTDGDHRFDRRTVFLENLNLVSGLEVGFHGVWIGAAPYLLFVPITDGDVPKPAGDPQILLDGWDFTADTHETLNTFAWGPDGWLYGCHGAFCPSFVGKPGAQRSERQWIDGGVWRYHPTRKIFEVFTEGGSNPWGIDFNEQGQLFAEMCVIPHFWQMIQGARIQRQAGEHFPITPLERAHYDKGSGKPVHPHIYADILQHGDHVHYAGQAGPHAGNARSDAAGGGHAHAGLMCYLGTSWPTEYRNQLFIGNIHGQRLNVDIPVRQGSGFVGKHGKDFLNFNDSSSQTLHQQYDQDGSMFIIDWYDKNQCHNPRDDGHDQSNGRIYKVVYKNQKTTRIDLEKLDDKALAGLVGSKNEFLSRHARRILQERASRNPLGSSTIRALRTLALSGDGTAEKLRGLWALHLTHGLDSKSVRQNLESPDEWVRAWTIQLVFEDRDSLDRLRKDFGAQWFDSRILGMADQDPSALVRLYLSSAAQRPAADLLLANSTTGARAPASNPAGPVSTRTGVRDLVIRLMMHGEDAADHNLALMNWFALEPHVTGQPGRILEAAIQSPLPRLLNFTTRRIASIGTTEARNLIAASIGSVNDAAKQREMLLGLQSALAGQRRVPMPTGWSAIERKLGHSPDASVRSLTQTLSLTFGSSDAQAALRKILTDKEAGIAARRLALESLFGAQDPEFPGLLFESLAEPGLQGLSLRALARYDDPRTPPAILIVYPSLNEFEKRDALSTLVSRPSFARSLLSAVVDGKVPTGDLTAEIVRQLRGMKDPGVQALLTKAYGATRELSADKKSEIQKYVNIYRAGYSQPGDPGRGRVLFNKVCAQCHTLFDSGGTVGPDITGSHRADVMYLLENIIDPNAVIPNLYRTSELETMDGRSLTGIVKSETANALTLQTANESLVLPLNEIASRRQTELSMMPEGLFSTLNDQEVRDLIYYLTRPGQVPLPATK